MDYENTEWIQQTHYDSLPALLIAFSTWAPLQKQRGQESTHHWWWTHLCSRHMWSGPRRPAHAHAAVLQRCRCLREQEKDVLKALSDQWEIWVWCVITTLTVLTQTFHYLIFFYISPLFIAARFTSKWWIIDFINFHSERKGMLVTQDQTRNDFTK